MQTQFFKRIREYSNLEKRDSVKESGSNSYQNLECALLLKWVIYQLQESINKCIVEIKRYEITL